ncbi:hypothetical protein [Mycolicibacterium fluoranthenivorans]|uniref:Uncharacterized protein n=1 Tax=Mycolicibacterium fluoranthenivorans TaxID=258505 RepID=A0A1G4WFU9_9MYCO|nr:hypothetical protein [Mycolicibacterium fluoranthenivorans]SCX22201.1 hypothetical protein SAMN02799620_03210 [Mycolicibacterium fluoranthenivorans]
MAEYEEHHLDPVVVEMRDVEHAGLVVQEPHPEWPGNAAPEAEQLAWNAGYAGMYLGAPISVTVLTHTDGRVTYGFSFHYVDRRTGTPQISRTPTGFTFGQANIWLDGAQRAARFLRHTQT